MKLDQILKDVFNITEPEIKDESRLMNYGEWDSMTHMFFITKLEDEYKVELTGDDIADMQTVGDVKKLIVAKGKEL